MFLNNFIKILLFKEIYLLVFILSSLKNRNCFILQIMSNYPVRFFTDGPQMSGQMSRRGQKSQSEYGLNLDGFSNWANNVLSWTMFTLLIFINAFDQSQDKNTRAAQRDL